MIASADIVLDFLCLGRNYAGEDTEKLCSAKWRLEASGPTNNIYHPVRATAALIRSSMAAPAVPATSNTRSAILGCGGRCQPSESVFETAARPISPSRQIASAIRHPWTKTNAPSWSVAAATIDGTTNATAVALAPANAAPPRLAVLAARAQANLQPARAATSTRATGISDLVAVTARPATAGAAPAASAAL